MKTLRAKLAKLAAAVVASLVIVSSAYAVPVTVVEYSGTDSLVGVSVELTDGHVFQTTGAAAITSFLNWAPFLPIADAIGKVKITGVNLTAGTAAAAFGLFGQATNGGLLEAFDAANNLLLGVSFTTGALTTTPSGTGSQLTIGIASFSGLLSSYFVPTSATHSFSFVNFGPAGIGDDGYLVAATGRGNGIVAGNNIPEPATMLLLGSGILGAAIKRRKAA